MRQAEPVSLRWEHIDLNRRTAHLPATKNGKSRDVSLSSTARYFQASLPATEAVKRAYIRAVRRGRD